MKNFTFLVIFMSIVSLIILTKTPSYAKAPAPVIYVNPNEFSGLWYEIARTYNSYEEDCVAPTVEYKQISKDKLEVYNRCFKEKLGANLKEYKGVVEPLGSNGNMSLMEKTYYWIFSQEYRIIYLDNYETAVVVDDEMEYVWVMNRKPTMTKKKLGDVISLLDNYIDTSKLIFPKQDVNGKYK